MATDKPVDSAASPAKALQDTYLGLIDLALRGGGGDETSNLSTMRSKSFT
jgi:hypothetical protein